MNVSVLTRGSRIVHFFILLFNFIFVLFVNNILYLFLFFLTTLPDVSIIINNCSVVLKHFLFFYFREQKGVITDVKKKKS